MSETPAVERAEPGGGTIAVGGTSFVLDGNLGLPVHEPDWAALLDRLGITTESSSDLVAIDRQVADHSADLAFIPAADYHGFRADPYYAGLAMATSARSGLPVQSSVLVVAAEDPARTVNDLLGASLGYVNASCSSSYFAPALLAARHGRRLTGQFTLVLTPPWQAQIDAVLDGSARATMVLEDVWAAIPANADRTRIVDRVDGLAPPVVLARADLDAAVREPLLAELLAWRPRPGATYGPFVPFDAAAVTPFFALLDGLEVE
jgi:ABC-type phosphate/phosphonate transport system substrate-binding protein